jgi:DNA repair photolyase
VPRFSVCRPKKALNIKKLKLEASCLNGELISISNSSDPYPNLEADLGLTRRCLEILSRSNCKIQIVTKSTLVTRDIDLLKQIPSMVSLTITTNDDELARKLEPFAPPPTKRLKAAAMLVKHGLSVTIRIDPVIPFLNDELGILLRTVASTGVKHVTCSTLKVKHDSWRRLSEAFPDVASRLKPLYFEVGEWKAGYRYLPRNVRFELMRKTATLAGNCGLKFGTCREGLTALNTAVCDGSWQLKET